MKKFIFIFTFIILLIDQITKAIVSFNMEVLKSIKVIPNFFYITYVRNEGAAFSIFQGGRIFFIIVSIIAIYAIIKYIFSDECIFKIEVLSYSLILGGIIGNLIDRVAYGSVIDFFDFYIFGYDFPIFNVADMALVIGVIILLANYMTKGEKNEINISRRRIK